MCEWGVLTPMLPQAFIAYEDDKKRRNNTGPRGWENIHAKFLELATKKFIAPEQRNFIARFFMAGSEHMVSASSVQNRWTNQGIRGAVYSPLIDALYFKRALQTQGSLTSGLKK